MIYTNSELKEMSKIKPFVCRLLEKNLPLTRGNLNQLCPENNFSEDVEELMKKCYEYCSSSVQEADIDSIVEMLDLHYEEPFAFFTGKKANSAFLTGKKAFVASNYCSNLSVPYDWESVTSTVALFYSVDDLYEIYQDAMHYFDFELGGLDVSKYGYDASLIESTTRCFFNPIFFEDETTSFERRRAFISKVFERAYFLLMTKERKRAYFLLMTKERK